MKCRSVFRWVVRGEVAAQHFDGSGKIAPRIQEKKCSIVLRNAVVVRRRQGPADGQLHVLRASGSLVVMGQFHPVASRIASCADGFLILLLGAAGTLFFFHTGGDVGSQCRISRRHRLGLLACFIPIPAQEARRLDVVLCETAARKKFPPAKAPEPPKSPFPPAPKTES